MGYKGFIRSVNSTLRAMERENRRKQREYEKILKEQNKLAEIERASLEVEQFENYLDVLQSLHKDCNEIINWNNVKNTTEPKKPNTIKTNEEEAIKNYENYKESVFDKILNKSEKKKNKLSEAIDVAKIKDNQINTINETDYKEKYGDWMKSVEIATKILNGDSSIYLDVIKEMSPLEEIENLGSSITFSIINNDFIECNLNVFGDKVIPKEIKSQLKSGKLSIKDMPVSKSNEIYQDYICSAVLRIAREVYSLLPINKIAINAVSNMLNAQTGHLEDMIILSVFMPRETVERINYESIDPSDCMKNFVCNMNFKKTNGFTTVEKVDYTKYS